MRHIWLMKNNPQLLQKLKILRFHQQHRKIQAQKLLSLQVLLFNKLKEGIGHRTRIANIIGFSKCILSTL
jgi:hypothetical protein